MRSWPTVTAEFFAALTANEVATLTSLARRVLAGGKQSCESPAPGGWRAT